MAEAGTVVCPAFYVIRGPTPSNGCGLETARRACYLCAPRIKWLLTKPAKAMPPGYPQTGGLLICAPLEMEFGKAATTLDEQIALLRERGMRIDAPDHARHCLRHINHYRLTAYWLPFEADHSTHRFRDGTRFEDALNLYAFDRALRLHLLDAIERIEVSLRTQWAYHMAHAYGPHAYLDPAHAKRADWHAANLASLEKEIERSDEKFIEHYRSTYTRPHQPPIWSVCEIMSLGLLSRWFTQLRPRYRSAIARTYGLDQKVLQAFIRHMSYVRNLCAHHSRVWNRRLTVTMKRPGTKPPGLAANFAADGERRIYDTLVMLVSLLDHVSPAHRWAADLRRLVEDHEIDVAQMGFPPDFRTRSIWKAVWND